MSTYIFPYYLGHHVIFRHIFCDAHYLCLFLFRVSLGLYQWVVCGIVDVWLRLICIQLYITDFVVQVVCGHSHIMYQG